MSVEKRGKTWAYRFSYAGEPFFKGGFPTAAEAEKAEERLRTVLQDPNTVSKLVQKRLEYVAAYCSKQHLIDTKAMLHILVCKWGHFPVSMVTKAMVQNLILDMAEKTSNNNVNRHIRCWKTLFQTAVDEELIARNPVKGIRSLPHTKRPRVIPSVGEIEEVLLKCSAEDRAYLVTIWQTAARVSEINKLTWEDVDWDRGTVWLSTRKTKDGSTVRREVPMLPKVRKALEYMWKNRVPGSPWVFTNKDMAQRSNDKSKWRYRYRSKFLKRLSGGRFSYHSLRHSTASTLAALGVEIPVIQKILGHSRPTTTDIYISTMPAGVICGMEKLGEFYG